MKDIHLHIWAVVEDDDAHDGPEEEIDLEWSDTYDDHYQYIGTLKDGRHLELRVPKTITLPEMFNLGAAYESFNKGDIDHAIDLILPTSGPGPSDYANDVFVDLFDDYFDKIDREIEDHSTIGVLYMGAIIRWATKYNVDIGRDQG